MAKTKGYVTTIFDRRRRLPDIQLPEYSFSYPKGYQGNDDILDFENEVDNTVPLELREYWTNRLSKSRFNNRDKVIAECKKKDNLIVTNNSKKIAEATRQCVNARIQGSASELTKVAMISLRNNNRLKELGFRMLIPIHDEIIAECPYENRDECSKLFADTMCEAAEKLLGMPIKCDVEITFAWYGKELEI